MNQNVSFNPQLILGIGNPGSKYTHTYHNLGIIATKLLVNAWPSEELSRTSSKKLELIRFQEIAIGQSQTFMNRSGEAAKEAMQKLHLLPKNILIVHDDSDLNVGRYKLNFGRGSAGHKGIISIIESLKTRNFWRLRIGIRPNLETGIRPKAETFVLKNITQKDRVIFKAMAETIIPIILKATD